MPKIPHWMDSYNIAMRSKRPSFLRDNAVARDEIHGRMIFLRDSHSDDDKREYGRLLLALSDLSVMAASFWKYGQAMAR